MIRVNRRAKKITAAISAVLCFLAALYWAISFEITLQTTGAGTLTCEKQRVHLLESANIRVYPSDTPACNALKRITVNGEDVTDRVRLQTLTIRYIHSDTVICAEFESATGKVVPANAPIFV